MNALTLFARTAGTGRLGLHLLYGAGTALVAGQIAAWALRFLGGGSELGAGAEATVLIAAFALGTTCGAVVVDVLLCPFAWALPRLRERLRAASLAIGLVAASLLAFLHAGLGGEGPAWAVAARAFLFFALGLQLDSFARTYFLGLAAVTASVLGAGWIARAGVALPGPLAFAALLGGVALLRLPFGQRRARAKALLPTARIGSVFGVPIHSADERASEEPEAAAYLERLGGGTRGWVRAALYEGSGGHTPLRWMRVVVVPIAMCAVGGAAFAVVLGWVELGSLRAGLLTARDALLGGPGSSHARMCLLMAAVMMGTFAAFQPNDFSTTLTYPLSRGRRAAVVWTAGLFQASSLCLIASAVLLAVGLAAGLAAGEAALAETPVALRALALSVVAAPFAHALQGRRPDPKRAAGQLRLLLPMGAAVAVILPGAFLWDLAAEDLGEVVMLAAWLAVAAGVQLLWRRSLRRRYARCDLA